ncbi:MAG: 3-hydroxyacyl-CoA dehydrogenase family protein [bacterium]|jgi:3-hydroxybutyryl-CoA dehydrogenase
MQVRRVGVVGGGTMGQGIVMVAAQAGFQVILRERNEEGLDRAQAAISSFLDDQINRWGITPKEKEIILSRITNSTTYTGFDNVDLVIEAIDEDPDAKEYLFQTLSDICPERVIFATNTSTLSVSKLANVSGRPDRFIGMHFQPPVPRKPLVELVRGMVTSDSTYQTVRNFAQEIKKKPIEVFEWPGYVTTRVMMPLINEAAIALMEGVASAEDIDKAMELGCGMQMGPLKFADAMGLDTVVFQMEHLFHELGDIKYRPCTLLKKMIRAGHLGMKSGQGFFKYVRPEAAKVYANIA